MKLSQNLKENIKILQKSAINYLNNNYSILKNITDKESFINYDSIVVKTKNKFLKNTRDIKFLDNTVYSLIDNKSLLYYLFNPKKLKSDFLTSYYKLGFLKSVFKINFPYLNILSKMYNIYKDSEERSKKK